MHTHEIISHVGELPVFFNYYTVTTSLIPSHWHKHIEIIYIMSGSMDIVTNDTTFTLYKGDIFMINSGAIHQTNTRITTSVLLLQIPVEFFENSVKDMDATRFKDYFPSAKLSGVDSFEKMTACLLDLLDIYKAKTPGYPFLFNSTLNQLLYQLYAHHSISNNITTFTSSKKNRIYLQKAIDYMALHYAEHIALSDIATHLALNPEYFCRMFKKHIGFTFLEYLNQIRLTFIYNDLMSSKDSITDIQERHGFVNYKVFNRMFKESYGCTPSAARKLKN